MPHDSNGAGVGPAESGDALDRGGLARAVRTEDADDLALGDVEVDSVHRDGAAVALPAGHGPRWSTWPPTYRSREGRRPPRDLAAGSAGAYVLGQDDGCRLPTSCARPPLERMTSPGALDLGHAAASARRWAEAYERLGEVESTAGLPAADLELFAMVAALRGRSSVSIDVLTRAHEAHLQDGDQEGAVRTAAWLALELIDLGEYSRSAGWVGRGTRLAEGLAKPSSVAGLARIPPALAELGAGNALEASRHFQEVAEIAQRCSTIRNSARSPHSARASA